MKVLASIPDPWVDRADLSLTSFTFALVTFTGSNRSGQGLVMAVAGVEPATVDR